MSETIEFLQRRVEALELENAKLKGNNNPSTIDFLIDLFTQTDNVIALIKMETLKEIITKDQSDSDFRAEVIKYLKG